MAFNASLVKNNLGSGGGVGTAFATYTNITGIQVPFTTKTTGSIVSLPSLTLNVAQTAANIEWESLAASIQIVIGTASVTITPIWQESFDNANWLTVYPHPATAYSTVAPAGAGTTSFRQYFGFNPSAPYLRIAGLTGGATTGSGSTDSMLVSYTWRKRGAVSIA